MQTWNSHGDHMPTVCLIPGDGVGQEVIPAAAQVMRAVMPDLRFVDADAGWDCFLRTGTALPDATVEAVAAADGALFGATQSPNEVVPGYRSPILALRRRFDLYANLRPTNSLLPEGPQLDFLIVRENTEGLYAGRERPRAPTQPSPSGSSRDRPASGSHASRSSRRAVGRRSSVVGRRSPSSTKPTSSSSPTAFSGKRV